MTNHGKVLKIYVDTSVIGGCFDNEFFEESHALLEMARSQKIKLLISDILADELALAPKKVQQELSDLPQEALIPIFHSAESEWLRDAYLKENVVGPKHINDAHHVALATISYADLIVSWNFKHIVHFDKIRKFNAVNHREGYPMIEIRSPKEVV